MVALLHDYPDVLRRVREEQHALRPNDEAITPDILDQMEYTSQVYTGVYVSFLCQKRKVSFLFFSTLRTELLH